MRPAPHYPLPSGDLRRLELMAPFDLPWFPTSANAFPSWVLRRIFPIPEEEFAGGGDWYLKHLTALFGKVRSLDETGAYYRIHGLNLYESEQATLELDHVRKNISLSATTRPHLERTARELELEYPEGPILSVADIANRMISLRLDPRAHPIGSDSRLGLLRAGAHASWRRVDVSPLMRLLFLGWFAAAAITPRAGVPWLGNLFLFPKRRRLLNGLLRSLHRTDVAAQR
jgi:hypothetical protein